MNTTYQLNYAQLSLCQRGTGRILGDFELDAPAFVDVDFDIEPGQREILRPDPDDCQEGFPATATICRVTVRDPLVLMAADDMALTLPSGFDLTEYLDKSIIERIEDELMEDMEIAA